MERIDLEDWIANHPDSIHTDPTTLLNQGEHDAMDHAHRDAWIHAKEIAQQSLRGFGRSSGCPASDTFVTREICHEIARELKRHEPAPEDPSQEKGEWISRSLLDALDSDAQRMFVAWLKEIAEKEAHSTWLEIVHYTDHRARALIRDRHMTDQCDWDLDHRYSLIAARVVRMLIADFEEHAALALEHSSDTASSH